MGISAWQEYRVHGDQCMGISIVCMEISAWQEYGVPCSILISDVDTVWMRNPLPFMAQYPQADCLTSSDHLVRPTIVGAARLREAHKAQHIFCQPSPTQAFFGGVVASNDYCSPLLLLQCTLQCAAHESSAQHETPCPAAQAHLIHVWLHPLPQHVTTTGKGTSDVADLTRTAFSPCTYLLRPVHGARPIVHM